MVEEAKRRLEQPPDEIPADVAAYAAGVIDSDGSIGVVLRFLRIKRRQAELCLEMRRLKDESRRARFAPGRGHAGGGKRPASISLAMEAVHAEVAALDRVEGRSARRNVGMKPMGE